jgi:tetratricopeptide (TPR) repeat protein
MRNIRLTASFRPILAVLLALSFGAALLPAQTQEDDAAALLRQADGYYHKGDYKLAVGTYLEAAAMSRSKLNLSAAYFGLALCYFYDRDMANSVKWMRQTAQIDPGKEISDSFYPKSFVDLFQSVRAEVKAKGLPVEEIAGAAPPRRQAEEPPPAKSIPIRRTELDPAAETKPRAVETTPVEEKPLSLGTLFSSGHWEVNLHSGVWTIDPIMGLFKGRLLDELGEELQHQVVKKLGSSYAGLVEAAYTPSLELDSQGGNYGLEIRYYARGWAGTFSFGASLEKTRIKLLMSGSAQQTFTNGATAQVEATAALETAPFSTNFGFRWEIGRGRLRPFLSLGFGFASFDGTSAYAYSGSYRYGSNSDSISEEETKTFAELSEDIDFSIPKNIILFQLGFGLKLEVYKGISLLAEAGIWDGLLLRGGLAYRF